MKSAEIVKALREDCKTCSEISVCMNGTNLAGFYCATSDAADLIERLEKEKAALLECVKWRCDLCKNFSGTGTRKRCWATWECPQCNIECSCRGCNAGSKWEWKGLVENK